MKLSFVPSSVFSRVTLLSSLSPQQYGLAIQTASPDLGFAISNFAGDRRFQTWAIGREASNYLHLYLSQFIQPQTWTDLAFLAVARGPGGFTGTRLGIVTARTLAEQLNLPLFAISTLAAIAWTEFTHPALAEPITTDIAVQMPAHRGEVYGAIYGRTAAGNLEVRLADRVMGLAEWQQQLADWPTPYQLVKAEGELGSTVQAVLDLAYADWQQGGRSHWSEALPFYGQSPV